MRKYLEEVERKRECYKKAFAQGQTSPFTGGTPQVVSYMESCMGWVSGSAESEGKPGTASPQELENAREKCRKNHCSWICDGPIESVHEKYHEWFDANLRLPIWVAVASAALDFGTPFVESGIVRMQQENIAGEIGAHDMEAQFLREALEQAEKDGSCDNVRKTISDEERERRRMEAWERTKKYLLSLKGTP